MFPFPARAWKKANLIIRPELVGLPETPSVSDPCVINYLSTDFVLHIRRLGIFRPMRFEPEIWCRHAVTKPRAKSQDTTDSGATIKHFTVVSLLKVQKIVSYTHNHPPTWFWRIKFYNSINVCSLSFYNLLAFSTRVWLTSTLGRNRPRHHFHSTFGCQRWHVTAVSPRLALEQIIHERLHRALPRVVFVDQTRHVISRSAALTPPQIEYGHDVVAAADTLVQDYGHQVCVTRQGVTRAAQLLNAADPLKRVDCQPCNAINGGGHKVPTERCTRWVINQVDRLSRSLLVLCIGVLVNKHWRHFYPPPPPPHTHTLFSLWSGTSFS